ncbi:unnamed protein product [Caenorhabditis auriculariae]|uniref:Geranylgeranyl transferase type-2 subunit alpha n=1 Tax=Caenorhabditis auriculariae TaxID=2777116 RepID=A0A8S1H5J3_9PELO|nr:unnamed protein product [Caenorhabditis auriculariae]
MPTTEEEKAVKKKENDKKCKLYLSARDKIFEKRSKGNYDDEILALTQAVLEKNSDNYTIWNIRREALQKRIDDNNELAKSETASDEEKAKSQRSIESLLAGELFMSYECIKNNPKIVFLLQELALCEKALKLDCRNFHVWDHRRIVARMAQRTADEEIEYSNQLVSDNFSNYSAWHYRSVLIQKVHMEKTGQYRLDNETIAAELKMIRAPGPIRGGFWMLAPGKSFLRPDSYAPIVPLSASFHGNNTTIVMSRACSVENVVVFVDSEEKSRWRGFSALSSHPKTSRVWQYLSDSPLRIAVEHDEAFSGGPWVEIKEKPYVDKTLLRRIYDVDPVESNKAVEELLADCQSLIELEPENKWPLYMKTLCLMEYKSAEAHGEIMDGLKKLGDELDVKRRKMYEALASRQQLNETLRTDGLLEKLMSGETQQLPLRYKEISSLEGVEYLAGLVNDLDVTGNRLTKPEEIVLPNLEHLTLNENPIRRLLPSASLGNLKFLSLAATEISQLNDLIPCLQAMSSLERLLYCETPLVEQTKELSAALPGVRLIPHYL